MSVTASELSFEKKFAIWIFFFGIKMYLKKLFQSPKNIFLSGILTPVLSQKILIRLKIFINITLIIFLFSDVTIKHKGILNSLHWNKEFYSLIQK